MRCMDRFRRHSNRKVGSVDGMAQAGSLMLVTESD